MDGISILVRSSCGRSTLASTDKGDIMVICEKDNIEPTRTGNPYVEKERGDYGVSGRTSGCAWTGIGGRWVLASSRTRSRRGRSETL